MSLPLETACWWLWSKNPSPQNNTSSLQNFPLERVDSVTSCLSWETHQNILCEMKFLFRAVLPAAGDERRRGEQTERTEQHFVGLHWMLPSNVFYPSRQKCWETWETFIFNTAFPNLITSAIRLCCHGNEPSEGGEEWGHALFALASRKTEKVLLRVGRKFHHLLCLWRESVAGVSVCATTCLLNKDITGPTYISVSLVHWDMFSVQRLHHQESSDAELGTRPYLQLRVWTPAWACWQRVKSHTDGEMRGSI